MTPHGTRAGRQGRALGEGGAWRRSGCGRRCGGNRGGSGSARWPPDRRCAPPCASGERGCRRGGRPAGYRGRGAPTPQPPAHRPLIGRVVGVHRSFPGLRRHTPARRARCGAVRGAVARWYGDGARAHGRVIVAWADAQPFTTLRRGRAAPGSGHATPTSVTSRSSTTGPRNSSDGSSGSSTVTCSLPSSSPPRPIAGDVGRRSRCASVRALTR